MRAAAGQSKAWESLVERYSRRLYALAQSRLRDPHLAEEVAQGVFLTVFQTMTSGGYTETGRFEPWLFRIAMNRIRDHVRRALSERARLTRTARQATATAEAPYADMGELEVVREAVAALPEKDQEIIGLRHQAGLEFKAIAELLGEPVGTLLARHHRALEKIRRAITVPLNGEHHT